MMLAKYHLIKGGWDRYTIFGIIHRTYSLSFTRLNIPMLQKTTPVGIWPKMRSNSLKQMANSETTLICTLCFTLLVMWITNSNPRSDPTLTKWGVLIHQYKMRTAWKVKFSVFLVADNAQQRTTKQHAKKTCWIWIVKKMTCDLHHSHLQLFELLPVINVARTISIIN